MKFKVISLLALIFCGLYTAQSSAYFVGAVIMQHPETKKIVVLLSDIHIASTLHEQYGHDNEKAQQEVITLIKELEKKGETVHFIIEDAVSAYKDGGYVSKVPFYISPLCGLIDKCKEARISYTNIEIRNPDYDKNLKGVADKVHKKIESEIAPEIMERLFKYAIARREFAYIDAHILNNINNRHDASITIVGVGAQHALSVEKILYHYQGYIKTLVKVSDGVSLSTKNELYSFKQYKRPTYPFNASMNLARDIPMENLKDTILKGIEEFKKIAGIETTIVQAIGNKNEQALITELKNAETGGQLLYHYIVIEPNIEWAKQFFKRGIYPLHKYDSKTLLYHLASRFEQESINILKSFLSSFSLHLSSTNELETKISSYINAEDDQGHTPLHIAAMCHNIKAIQLLLHYGANINARDENNLSALHWALVEHNATNLREVEATVKLLLENKAEVDAQDSQGNTPLHYASRSYQLNDIFKILKKNKANIYRKNIKGDSPYDINVKMGKEYLCYSDFSLYDVVSSWIKEYPKKAATFAIGSGFLLAAGISYYTQSNQQSLSLSK